MRVKAEIDPGICNFLTTVYAETEDAQNVSFEIETECELIQEIAKQIKEMTPIDAYQELSPVKESLIMGTAREVLVAKGCCEACIVPEGIVKAMYVAAKLALPKDCAIKFS